MNFFTVIVFLAMMIPQDEPVVITTKPEIIEELPPINLIYFSCIKTARKEGLDLPRGDAIDLVPNSLPTIGGAILFKYGPTAEEYHVAVTLEFRENGFWVVEGNKEKGKKTYRLVAYNDPTIRGFWTRQAYEQSLPPLLSPPLSTSLAMSPSL